MYEWIVVGCRPQQEEQNRILLVMGDNLINYPGDVKTPIVDINTAKIIFNSVISTSGAIYMCCGVKQYNWVHLCPDKNT